MIHQFKINFKNRSLKMKELPSQMGGGNIHKKRLGGVGDLGGYIPNSDSKGRKVGGDLPGVMT